jgi:hypothetical protein
MEVEEKCNCVYCKNALTKKEFDDTLAQIKRATKKMLMLNELQVLQDSKDYELAHITADELLLAYIGDKEITEAFNKITKY